MNVLTFMDETNIDEKKIKYPTFDLLRRALKEQRRIEVLVRDCRGIYAVLIGWLLAFDKQMNLILSDVDEVFRRLTDGKDFIQYGANDNNVNKHEQQIADEKKNDNKMSMKPVADYDTFRQQLTNFLKHNPKKPLEIVKKNVVKKEIISDDEEEDEFTSECQPENLLRIHLLNTEKSSSSIPPQIVSKRAKPRFFSRHIPKLFVKGNEICLVRLLLC
ncbi:unnamed protein product [Didymodactylos carnosus]|uniref:LSM domain-containing protein n=1 Tax=Didymodactylos carnosus TaxID=1234261 RepID=A0A813QS06_9BILA|nr:unnamed protein product [Didymodactylos carnosus]CAF0794618.1 unnamed protein product [Didymodactylos carnosus]CAF3554810.1 unnamed protein product [Didymodactylos carnosus]CAF3577506.1 unnamed protein product [Didymodactylos carnosus]